MCVSCNIYNDWYILINDRVRVTVIDVEYPLIESRLEKLDSQLENSITTLNWTSNGNYRTI